MTDQVIGLVADYGALAIFLLLAVNCLGLPFPSSLVVLATGSLAEQGQLDASAMLLAGIAGAVAGDQLGYAIGRWGGTLVDGGAARHRWLASALAQAERFEGRWGDLGIFLTRWLFTPLGPWVNLFAGATRYSWPRFTLWDVAGESLWVSAYVGLGMAFSRSVQSLAAVVGDFTWLAVFAAAAVYLGWQLFASSGARRQG